VDEEYQRRNAEYMEQLHADNAFVTKAEIIGEWGITEEEYEEMFSDDSDE